MEPRALARNGMHVTNASLTRGIRSYEKGMAMMRLFVISPRPERDVEGAVFTVQHGEHESVWVNSIRDMESRHFQYVYFIPDALVTVIDVRFFPISVGATKVEVMYTRTALNVDANPHVRALGVSDAGNGTEWQKMIEKYLKDANSRTSTR